MILIAHNDSRQLPCEKRFTPFNRDTVWTQKPHVRLWYVPYYQCEKYQCGVKNVPLTTKFQFVVGAKAYVFKKTKRCSLTRKSVAEQTGIGWSEAGLERYNELYDLVVEDRVLRGAVFNNELLNVFVER